jgi:thiol:disulfide interchange protein DsbC
MNQFKIYLASVLFLLTTGVSAVEQTSDNNKITDLLKARLGGAAVEAPSATPAEGIFETRFGSKIAYLTSNGRYVFIGDMIDLESQVNLTEISRRDIAKEAIDEMPVEDLVVFPADNDTRTVLNIFTDTSCPYCKKIHEEIPQLQKAGIEVRYIPFPRGGAKGPGYTTLKQVWCAKDRARAMNIAKEVESGELSSPDCAGANIVDKGYTLGNQVGVTGTPALFTQSGKKFDGYVPYKQLIPALLSGL